MTPNPPLCFLQGGELNSVHPVRVPLLGAQGWVNTQIYFKYLWLRTCTAALSLLGWGDTLWSPDTLWRLKEIRAPRSVAPPSSMKSQSVLSQFLGRSWNLILGCALLLFGHVHAVTFQTSDHATDPGSSITVPVKVSGFSGVTSFQFTLAWHPEVLQYVDNGDYGLAFLRSGSFGKTRVSQGKLTVGWDDEELEGKALGDGTTLFTVTFNAVGINGSTSSLSFSDDPTQREVSVDFSIVGFNSTAGTVQVGELLVGEPPSISVHPISQLVTVGTSATLSVQASGTRPLSFQWWKDGDQIPGATASTFALNNAQASATGGYSVTVSNFFGNQVSATATLTLVFPVIAEPPVIENSPRSHTVNEGDQVRLFVSAVGTQPLSYEWLKDGFIIPGATRTELTLTGVNMRDAGNYTVVVSNSAGSASSLPAVISVAPALGVQLPSILVQPQSLEGGGGGTIELSVLAAGSAPLSFQWRKDGIDIVGATEEVLVLNNLLEGDAGDYSVGVSNAGGTVVSEVATLKIGEAIPGEVPVITIQPVSRAVEVGDTARFTVLANGTAPLRYQWHKDGQALSNSTDSLVLFSNVQLRDAGVLTVNVSNAQGNVTSDDAFLAVNDGSRTADAVPAFRSHPMDQVVPAGGRALFSPEIEGALPMKYQWRKNGIPIVGENEASLVLENVSVEDEGSYSVSAENGFGRATSVGGLLNVKFPPKVTAPLVNQTVRVGSSVEFVVTAAGSEPLSYEWRRNEQPLPGANGSRYVLPRVSVADAGEYSVVVSSSVGTVESNAATLTIATPIAPMRSDLNGDGFADLVFQDAEGFLAAWIMSETDLSEAKLLSHSNVGDLDWKLAAVGDFDQDARADLVFQHRGGRLAIWMMDGATLKTAALLPADSVVSPGWTLKAVGDFNRDRKQDLVFQHRQGTVAVWFMDGTRRVSSTLTNPTGPNDALWRVVAAGDFDGDKEDDLVFQHADGLVAIWLMSGTHLRNAVIPNQGGAGDTLWRVVGSGDYNGDNNSDILFQHSGDGAVAVWILNGTGFKEARFLSPTNPGGTWRIAPSFDH